MYTVQIHRIEENRIYVDWIDADDGTPIADIKIFVERLDCSTGRKVEEWELDIGNARQIGGLNLIPRVSEHLDELEEVSPEEYIALVVELGAKTTHLTAKELVELIKVLEEVYEKLPVEIKDKLKSQSSKPFP
ncbi:TrmO family methyltransferase [Thermococcus sp. M39]|uniref:TrmO family methyltransferase domain-containing protein n=1 Tax=unclassified Thermococcus TaxID=2627626 RepID=UPI003211EADB